MCGPNVTQQCRDAGLLDEVRVDLVPVLLGEGVRYFGGLAGGDVALEDPDAHWLDHTAERIGTGAWTWPTTGGRDRASHPSPSTSARSNDTGCSSCS